MHDGIPQSAWYSAAMAYIAATTLWLAGQRHWSTFVGQWPPTFLLLALFHGPARRPELPPLCTPVWLCGGTRAGRQVTRRDELAGRPLPAIRGMHRRTVVGSTSSPAPGRNRNAAAAGTSFRPQHLRQRSSVQARAQAQLSNARLRRLALPPAYLERTSGRF